ncbi:hypothetical protein ACWIUH_10305 [Ursidibacter arcticus]
MKLQKILKNLPLVFILLNTSGKFLAKNRVDSEVSSILSHSKSTDGNFERTILDQIGTDTHIIGSQVKFTRYDEV